MAKKIPRKKLEPKVRPVQRKPLIGTTPIRKQIIKLLMEGKLPKKEIVEQLAVNPDVVKGIRGALHKRGIRTLIPNTVKPPLEVAKSVLMLEVLLQVTGEKPTRCLLKAEAIMESNLKNTLFKHPQVLIDAREFRNGHFWREAHEEIADEIETVKKDYEKTGKKYDPSVSLASEVAKNRLRTIKAKNKR